MSRYSRDDAHGPTNPPASLIRRRTDFGKESGQEESSKEASPKVDTGSFALKRTTTGGLGSNTSAWAQTPSATFSPIGGAFGSFALSPSASTSEKRPGFGSLRGESKFKNLLKEANEQDEQTIREKASVSSLSRENWRESKDTRSRGNREMPGGDEGTSGSAALQGTDGSTPRLTSGLLSGIGVSMGQDLENDDSGLLQNLTQQTPHRRDDHGETLSPTNTNPYQSPENEKSEPSDLSGGLTGLHATHPGLGGFDNESESINPLAGLGSLGLSEAINERNQTTSAGMFGGDAFRGLAPLPGLGSASAWSATLPTAGTPTRERPQGTFGGAFGDSIFSPIENPAAVGPFPPTGFGPSNVLGGFGRGGRLGLLSNQAIDRSRSQESRLSGDTLFDALPHQDLSGIGPNAFSNGPLGSALPRDSDSPIHHARGFDVTPTAPPNLNAESSTGQLFTSAGTPSTSYSALAGPSAIGPQRQVQGIERPGSVGGGQPAAPLVRIMVMPDRMKWEYKDHQGQTQGPFSGLEMHDWYKAGYFTPELQIKKLEDTQFEPLAHLIRRIGNSREPFLVPQIGVPHDPPSNQRGWQTGGPGGIQPPFANSFPSFGTTLTAEQQNDLERRKQESQYLMARQKEYLAQQQQTLRMQQQLHPQPAGIFPPQLHHQASAQSLHSQPSFGSMTNAFAQNPSAPMMSGQQLGGIMENSFRGPGAPGQMNPLNNAHEEDSAGLMDNVNIEQQLISGSSIAGPLGLGPGPEQNSHAQQVAAMLSDRARLQMEAAEAESFGRLNQDNFTAQMAAERLQQFRDLQEDQEGRRMTDNTANEGHLMTTNQFLDMASHQSSLNFESDQEQSITQQVQAAVSAKASQPPAWQRIDMQSIIPPPQSTSPMPAPIAQRKHNVADKLTTAGSPSPSHTPVVETPTSSSIAPWAKEAPELPKASLKDIQEAEAKKAAKQEEIAAAARRAQLEKDILVAQQAAAAAAQAQPGLPSSSTWASSPAAASGNGASVWSKASAGIRTNVPAPGLTTKKTLQQIQKEEEARKQRAAVAGASAGGTAPISAALSSGKRYADLASKSSTVPGAAAPMAASAWTTVGAGGKVKSPVPSGPAPVTRSISGGVATSIPVQPARPKQAMRSTTLGATAAQQSLGRGNDVVDELKRWAVKELGNHLNKGLNGKSRSLCSS
jgi:PERQ amino acid-rich with GYF domain-containing protein